MRKPLLATTAACLLALGPIGCGDQSNDAKVNDDLNALIQKMDLLQSPLAANPDNNRVYSGGTTVDGVEIPADRSFGAQYVDQALSMLPLAEDIARNGNDLQVQTANSIIANIKSDEAAYLIEMGQGGYQAKALEISKMHQRITILGDLSQINQALSGDRAEIIDTIQTGKVDANTTVQGIDQLSELADDAEAKAEAARAQLAKLNAEIASLGDDVAEYEGLELQLSNSALSAQGKTKYDNLSKATDAAYEAQIAKAKAESLLLDVQLQTYQAELSEAKQSRNSEVVSELKARIEQVKEEKKNIANRLATLNSESDKIVKGMAADFARLDKEIEVLGFDRMEKAEALLKEATQAVQAASLARLTDRNLLGVYLLRSRNYHQQSLAARSYAEMLESLAAAGPSVIGSNLHADMTDRIDSLNALAERVSADAAAFQSEIDAMLSTLEQGAGSESENGTTLSEQVQLVRSLLRGIPTAASTPAG